MAGIEGVQIWHFSFKIRKLVFRAGRRNFNLFKDSGICNFSIPIWLSYYRQLPSQQQWSCSDIAISCSLESQTERSYNIRILYLYSLTLACHSCINPNSLDSHNIQVIFLFIFSSWLFVPTPQRGCFSGSVSCSSNLESSSKIWTAFEMTSKG